MKYLIVVAHPDDEVLGAGGTIAKLTASGHAVDLAILCAEARARAHRPDDDSLNADLEASSRMLGIGKIIRGDFPNIEMNTVPHLRLVQFVEKAIQESAPDVVITHHPTDSNDDHCQTSHACQVAIRLFQRRPEVKPVNELWFMEIASSTEWSVDSSAGRFEPNLFVEIGADALDLKLKALATYRGVMRPYPHPRSEESLRGIAAWRGSQSGLTYAEAFECVFRRVVL